MDFLYKYLDELNLQREEIEAQLDTIRNSTRENSKFLEMLEEENQTFFHDFSPRYTEEKNKDRIFEIQTQMKELNDQRTELTEQLEFIHRRIGEVSNYIDKQIQSKNQSELESKLRDIHSYVISDPVRAKIEIENIIKNLS